MRALVIIGLLAVSAWGQTAVKRQTVAEQFYNTVVGKAGADSPYTVAAGVSYVACDATNGAVVINLPAATGTGREITIKKTDASGNACTPTRTGSDTIDGATSYSLTVGGASSKVVDAASGTWQRSHVNQVSGDASGVSTAMVIKPAGGPTTATPVAVSTTASSAYYFNQHATAAASIEYDLPAAAANKQFCFFNSNNGSAANTGALTIKTSAAGQYIIFTDGTLSASGGNVASSGAAADGGCVVGVDSTHWLFTKSSGTWAKN